MPVTFSRTLLLVGNRILIAGRKKVRQLLLKTEFISNNILEDSEEGKIYIILNLENLKSGVRLLEAISNLTLKL